MQISAFVLSFFLFFSTLSRFAYGVPLPHGPSGQVDIQNAATKDSIASPASSQTSTDVQPRNVTYPAIQYGQGVAHLTGDRLAVVEQFITQKWHDAGKTSGAWTATAAIHSATSGHVVITADPAPANGHAIMTAFNPSTLSSQLKSPI
ncbi:hypothetical protein FRC18_007596 [Serendipita sp. 400]|nr:hypothetical protein FRC18_007596 [Serendipita sp. 400]